MKSVYVIGFDPGLSNLGYAVARIYTNLDPTSRLTALQDIVTCGVITTDKCDKKTKVLASDDNVRRAREMWTAMQKIATEYRPSCVCSESQSIPRNAANAAKTSFSWGLIAAFVQSLDIPMAQVSPQAMKKTLCGKRDASKEEIEAAVRSAFPETGPMLDSLNKTKREHAADSVGAIAACYESDVMQMLRRSVIA